MRYVITVFYVMLVIILIRYTHNMKLVKYLPETVLDSFLEDPCLRLTPSMCFEDTSEFGAQSDEVKNNPTLKKAINMHGVVSLTKSEKSSSMWTNYANNHKGFSFVLEVDDSDVIGSIFHVNPVVDTSLYIAKNIQYYTDLKPFSDYCEANAIFDYYQFQKHISFLAEDEFRLVLPFYYVDIIKIHHLLFESDSFFEGLDLEFIYDGFMFYSCDFKKPYNLMVDLNAFQRHKLWTYSFDKGDQVIFLKRIDFHMGSMGHSASIRKLILGYDFDLKKFTSDIKTFRNYNFFNRRFISSPPSSAPHKKLINIFKINNNDSHISYECVDHIFI